MPLITDWIQAAAAVATAVLAIVVLIQGRKIKTLTHVVKKMSRIVTQLRKQTQEQAEQTKILFDGYRLQLKLTMKDSMPVFKFVDKKAEPYANDEKTRIIIKNVGQPAHEVKLMDENNHEVTMKRLVNMPENRDEHDAWEIIVNKFFAVSFIVSFQFETESNEAYVQTIRSISGYLYFKQPEYFGDPSITPFDKD